jgi:hypothetical protein
MNLQRFTTKEGVDCAYLPAEQSPLGRNDRIVVSIQGDPTRGQEKAQNFQASFNFHGLPLREDGTIDPKGVPLDLNGMAKVRDDDVMPDFPTAEFKAAGGEAAKRQVIEAHVEACCAARDRLGAAGGVEAGLVKALVGYLTGYLGWSTNPADDNWIVQPRDIALTSTPNAAGGVNYGMSLAARFGV